MRNDFVSVFRRDFEAFAQKAFGQQHGGEGLGRQRYIDYLCHELAKVADGETKKLVINLPPRHLKTFLAAICLTAWMLGRKPSAKIIVVTYSEALAKDIAYQIRDILKSNWYKEIFTTRLAEDRSSVFDFGTKQGGSVYAVSADGSITGRGADLIIFDDPLDIKDAGNLEQIQKVNQRFDTLISSRLNNPKTGQFIIIAHRLHECDLSGHVLGQGGWRHVALPLIAPRKKTYDLGHERWERMKDELLRPNAFTRKDINRLRANTMNPDFDTFYQQSAERGAQLRIKRDHFIAVPTRYFLDKPVVLSVDAGQRRGPNSSFSVIQAWTPFDNDHILIDQWREKCDYEELRSAFWRFVRHYRPAACLIEDASNGCALISQARKRGLDVVDLVPDGRSKTSRLSPHVRTIRNRHIHLPDDALWRDAFITEFVEFPTGPNDDQVDATSQYLDWIAKHPSLKSPAPRALAAAADHLGQPIKSQVCVQTHTPHGVLSCRSRW
jgi:predicted phage terminase large subunit-like protein